MELRSFDMVPEAMKGYLCAPVAQRHDDGRVVLHRLLHDRRGAEAAPDDLVPAECVHINNPEVDALTCRHEGMLCVALASSLQCGKLSRKPTEARLYTVPALLRCMEACASRTSSASKCTPRPELGLGG